MKLSKTIRSRSCKAVALANSNTIANTSPPRIKTPSPLVVPHLLSEDAAIAPWLTNEIAEPTQTVLRTSIRQKVQLYHPTPSFPGLSPDSTSAHVPAVKPKPIIAPPNSEVTLLVGKQASRCGYLTPQLFVLPASYFQTSPALSKYIQLGEGVTTADQVIHLANLYPDAFSLYCEYLSTGRLDLRRQASLHGQTAKRSTWAACWPLVNAHILATTIGDPAFANFIMRVLTDRLACDQDADLSTIKHVFSAPGVSIILKQFVADEAVKGGMRNFSAERMKEYPTSFIAVALHRAAQTLALLATPSDRFEQLQDDSRYSPNTSDGKLDSRTAAIRKLREVLEEAVMSRESQRIRMELRDAGVQSIDFAVLRKPQAKHTSGKEPKGKAKEGSTLLAQKEAQEEGEKAPKTRNQAVDSQPTRLKGTHKQLESAASHVGLDSRQRTLQHLANKTQQAEHSQGSCKDVAGSLQPTASTVPLPRLSINVSSISIPHSLQAGHRVLPIKIPSTEGNNCKTDGAKAGSDSGRALNRRVPGAYPESVIFDA